jgi:hypothetical protein
MRDRKILRKACGTVTMGFSESRTNEERGNYIKPLNKQQILRGEVWRG